MFENFKKLSIYPLLASTGFLFSDRNHFVASVHVVRHRDPMFFHQPRQFYSDTDHLIDFQPYFSVDETVTEFMELGTQLSELIPTPFKRLTFSERMATDAKRLYEKGEWEKSAKKYLKAEELRREHQEAIYLPIQNGMLTIFDVFPDGEDGIFPPLKIDLFISLISCGYDPYPDEALSRLRNLGSSTVVGQRLLRTANYKLAYELFNRSFSMISSENVHFHLGFLAFSLELAKVLESPKNIRVLRRMNEKFHRFHSLDQSITSLLTESRSLLAEIISGNLKNKVGAYAEDEYVIQEKKINNHEYSRVFEALSKDSTNRHNTHKFERKIRDQHSDGNTVFNEVVPMSRTGI